MSRLIEIPLLKTNGLGNVLSTMGGGGSGGGIPGPTGPTGDAESKSTYVYAPNYVDTLPVGTYPSCMDTLQRISETKAYSCLCPFIRGSLLGYV